MDQLSKLTKTTLAKGHNVLIDIEFARMCNSTQEQIQQLHNKFYSIIPHKDSTIILSENQIYVKRALIMAEIKDINV
jgi:hypothetical protein